MRRSSYHSFYSLRFVSCILLFALFAAQSVLAQDWDFVDVSPGRWINMELNDVFFIGGQGWAAGANGTIIHTHDGTRWDDQASGVDTDLYGIYFETTLIGWAVGERGTILNTEDSGITWKQQESPTSATLYDVNFSLAGDGLIVGSSGTILGKLSHNRTWTIDEDEGIGRNNLNAVYMYNNTRGWAVGDGGTILFWNGSGWLEQVNPSVRGKISTMYISPT